MIEKQLGKQSDPPEFDSFAEKYEELIRDPIRERFANSNRFFFQRKLEMIRAFYRRRKIDTRKLKWLDVGCGQGDLLLAGRQYFASVTGCDPSPQMLQSCVDLEVKEQTSVNQLPFDDSTFDFVTAVCVYHHVLPEHRLSLTQDALRVLKPGGILCMIEHNPHNPVTKLIVSRTPVDADAQLLTPRKTRELFRSAGSAVVDSRHFLFFPERLYKTFGVIESGLSWIPLGGQYLVFAQKSGQHAD